MGRAAAGDTAMQILTAQQQEAYLDQAVAQGRISVHERPLYHAQMQRDMAGTVQLLSGLTPGRVPVAPAPIGVPNPAMAAMTGGAGIPDAAWDTWEAEVFGTTPAAAAPAAPAAAPAYGVPAPVPAGVAGATVPGGF
jgi:hypothetical protein